MRSRTRSCLLLLSNEFLSRELSVPLLVLSTQQREERDRQTDRYRPSKGENDAAPTRATSNKSPQQAKSIGVASVNQPRAPERPYSREVLCRAVFPFFRLLALLAHQPPDISAYQASENLLCSRSTEPWLKASRSSRRRSSPRLQALPSQSSAVRARSLPDISRFSRSPACDA